VRFTYYNSTSETETEIPYWIETCDLSASDNATFWVKVPFIQNNSNAKVYMYYGNSEESSASNFDNTFTKNFEERGLAALWHMDTGSGTTAVDSSGNGNNGVINGATWNGSDGGQWASRSDVKFSTGDSLILDGDDDYVDCGDALRDSSGDTYTEGTIAFWYNPKGPWYNYNTIYDNSVDADSWEMWIYSTGVVATRLNNSGAKVTYDLDNLQGPDNWYNIVFTWKKEGKKKLYVQGVLRDTQDVTWAESGDHFYLGSGNTGNTQGNGTIDEVRIYDRALSADEIKAHYERRKYASPEPTASVGAEEVKINTASNEVSYIVVTVPGMGMIGAVIVFLIGIIFVFMEEK